MNTPAAVLLLSLLSSLASAQSSQQKQSEPVSITSILKNVDVFHGQRIVVGAYLRIQFEGDALCASAQKDEKQCIWFEFDNGPFDTDSDVKRYKAKQARWSRLSGHLVKVEGLLKAGGSGHLGMYPAELSQPKIASE